MGHRQDAVWKQWCSDFDAVYEDARRQFHYRWFWRCLVAMQEQNPDVTWNVLTNNWLMVNYTVTQCTWIRRECDTRTTVASLARCLVTVRDHPKTFTSCRFVSLLPEVDDDWLRDQGIRSFEQFDPVGEGHVAKTVVESDLATLSTTAERANRYTTKVLAHREREAEITLEWSSLNTAMETIGQMVKRYYQLRHPGQVLRAITPVIEGDWTTPFRRPWVTENYRPPNEWDLG